MGKSTKEKAEKGKGTETPKALHVIGNCCNQILLEGCSYPAQVGVWGVTGRWPPQKVNRHTSSPLLSDCCSFQPSGHVEPPDRRGLISELNASAPPERMPGSCWAARTDGSLHSDPHLPLNSWGGWPMPQFPHQWNEGFAVPFELSQSTILGMGNSSVLF